MKCRLHVCGVQSGGLDEREVVLLRERLGFVSGHSPKVAEVALVAHQHNDNVGVRVVP